MVVQGVPGHRGNIVVIKGGCVVDQAIQRAEERHAAVHQAFDAGAGAEVGLDDAAGAAGGGYFGGQGFGAFKPALADLAVSSLAPVTAEMRRLMDDPVEIDRVLKDGAERAAEIADPVVDEVKKIVGFWRA